MRRAKSAFIFAAGLLFILAAVFLSTHYNASRTTPLPPPTQTIAGNPNLLPSPTQNISTPLQPVSGGFGADSHPEITRVTLEQAKAAFDDKSALFIDVRSASDYTFAHIPGALNIPLGDIANRLNELDPNQWIICYCT